MGDFIETKRYPDGREARFDCSLVAYDGRTAVARFVYERGFVWQGHVLPRGGYTLAWFWRGRRYLLYRMFDGDGRRILDRFDVVDGLRLGRGGVDYRDLYLDVWSDHDGVVRVDDEDELAAAEAARLVSAAEAQDARRIAARLVREQKRIIAKTQRWFEGLSLRGSPLGEPWQSLDD